MNMEPVFAAVVSRRSAIKNQPPYVVRHDLSVTATLQSFFDRQRPGSSVCDLRRMGGGASKEQFVFSLVNADTTTERLVLRMDPLAAISETDRKREFQILEAMQGFVPAPRPMWLDVDGSLFGQPSIIMAFVDGVTKPSDSSLKVSGLGTNLGDMLRSAIAPQFLDCLVRVHGFDWRNAHLSSFVPPDQHPQQAAQWAVNYWRAMWDIDCVEERPIFALAYRWLLDNMPSCDEFVLTHGDYRTGNYLFDETDGRITAILDWELTRLGDFHEDLAWIMMKVFGTFEKGRFRASDLFEPDALVSAYERRSGRTVNRATLHYYAVLSSWKCYIITVGTGLGAARHAHNHQDVLLTFLGATGAIFADDLCRLLSGGGPK
jgi:aminoglycoside phosphotransferase (APT) family kinase protein